MKRIILTILMLFMLNNIMSSQTKINAWGGYSFFNGIIGAEAQNSKFGISAGFVPFKSNDGYVSSFSSAINYYWNDMIVHPYTSLGISSAAYHSPEHGVEMMMFCMTGLQIELKPLDIKTGIGYGWCKYQDKFSFEIIISRKIISN